MRTFLFNLSAVALILLFALSVIASGAIPPEAKSFILKFYSDYSSAADSLIKAVENTDDPGELAKAFTAFADSLEPLLKQTAELEKKYGDLFDSIDDFDEEGATGDADIARAEAEFEKYEEKLAEAMLKVFQHFENPEVKAAMDRLDEIMSLYDTDDYEEDDHKLELEY